MKRRSMLGRRSRAVQQSPLSAAFPSQSSSKDRNPETPRLPTRDKTSPHPFQTPSVNGSLSDLSSRVTENWSVFKNANVRVLRSPESERRPNTNARTGHSSRLNRLRKNDPLCELRNKGFSNILPRKNGVGNAFEIGNRENKKPPTVVSSVLTHGPDKYKLYEDVKGSVVSEESTGSQSSMKESDQGRVTRELLNLQKKWEHQDIRAVSPPWSSGPNTLSDFNLHTPRPTPTAVIVTSPPKSPCKPVDFSTTLGVAFLESSVVNRKDEVPGEKQDTSFVELESMVNEENNTNPQSLDLSTVLGNVSLGVNTIELLDKPNFANLNKASWGTKCKSPLLAVAEESEVSLVDKENLPPSSGADNFCSPAASNETVVIVPAGVLPRTPSSHMFKKFQDQLADLTSKIEAAEEKRLKAEEERLKAEEERLKAEEERKFFEVERKKVFVDFFNFVEKSGNETERVQQVEKRRKLAPTSAKKGRPSFVASKLFKKDLKSPKDIAQFVRTPSQMPTSASYSHVPFTPRSLRKNLNQQFNSIFGS